MHRLVPRTVKITVEQDEFLERTQRQTGASRSLLVRLALQRAQREGFSLPASNTAGIGDEPREAVPA